MNRLWLICLASGLAGFTAVADTTPMAISPPVRQKTAIQKPPLPLPTAVSPVALFRRLLDMSEPEREKYLTNRPPEVRVALRAKIREYLAMNADDRELRLRATELRWRLMPLLRVAPADRGPQLALVPEDLAPLVQSRLAEWDKLPPNVQAEFLANNSTLHYFAEVARPLPPLPGSTADQQRFQNAIQLSQFFKLTPEEEQKTLKTLSATERAQMENTLAAFGKLTGRQRIECVRAFTRFASLGGAERAEFLKNAERWSRMSPKERQTWRDLVARVPSWPPLPPKIGLPLPPSPATRLIKEHQAVATNHN